MEIVFLFGGLFFANACALERLGVELAPNAAPLTSEFLFPVCESDPDSVPVLRVLDKGWHGNLERHGDGPGLEAERVKAQFEQCRLSPLTLLPGRTSTYPLKRMKARLGYHLGSFPLFSCRTLSAIDDQGPSPKQMNWQFIHTASWAAD